MPRLMLQGKCVYVSEVCVFESTCECVSEVCVHESAYDEDDEHDEARQDGCG